MNFLIRKVSLKKYKSMRTCVFIDKKCARKTQVRVDYRCFEVGNDFVVGCGLDCNDFFKTLPYVGKVKETV